MKSSMTLRLGASIVAVACLAAPPVHADEPMSVSELEALMSGNSINGVFGDNQLYRQNNHSDGYAVVHLKGDRILNIPWFTKEEGGVGLYCEDWRAIGWDVYCFTAQRKSATEVDFIRPTGEVVPVTWTKGFIDLNY